MLYFTSLPKETAASDENKIDRIAKRLIGAGFSDDILVCRNSFDASLAILASSQGGLRGEYTRAVFPRGNCVVIAARHDEDIDHIRRKMVELRPLLIHGLNQQKSLAP